MLFPAKAGNPSTHSRRHIIRTGLAAGLAMPALMRSAFAQDGTVRIGIVSPQTGPLAFFGAPDAFVFQRFASQFEKGGGAAKRIQLIVKDSQSSANRASEVAAGLILNDKVDLLITAGGPDTVNPVSDQAEINGVPCISNACPWQPFIFGRKGTPAKGFEWTYLFAFGIEDVIAAYLSLWASLPTNKKVALILANDADGNAWGHAQTGFPPALAKAGYQVVDTGRYTPMADDYTAQISAMKAGGVDIVMGTMLPPEFTSFWSQAKQQGLSPQIATIGKTLLLPTTLEAIGPRGNGLSAEVAWTPDYPFVSATTGETARQLGEAWVKATNRQWTQPLGIRHSLLDVAVDVVRRAKKPHDPASLVESIKATDIDTMIGRVNWSNSPIRNVAKTPMVAGQWRFVNGKYELAICGNPTSAPIPLTGPLLPLA